MSRGAFLAAWLVCLTAALTPFPAFADGILIPDPPCPPSGCTQPVPLGQLAIERHNVSVRIESQVAVTHVDQVFRNDGDDVFEGTYVFPLPDGAAVNEFRLWIGGEPVEARMLTADEARSRYQDIVRSLRDPALLEYVERGAVQASLFPIAPGERRRIELEYTQVLTAERGLVHYRYPLNTEKFSTAPLESVSMIVEASSGSGVGAVYSPGHEIDVERPDGRSIRASWEASGVTPQEDFEIYFALEDEAIGLHLLTSRDPLDDDLGYFLLLAAPPLEAAPADAVARDWLFVVDRSGSMGGEKIEQVQSALVAILAQLGPKDRFNLLAFNSQVEAFAGELQPAERRAEARDWVQAFSARGATDIESALMDAVEQVDAERPTTLVFLTDGLPTDGTIDTQEILERVERATPAHLQIFVFGVGFDVDTMLLDSLARSHHGAAQYVPPGDPIDAPVRSLYETIASPVLTDISIDFGEAGVRDVLPDPLPDLFAGQQLLIVGRYARAGRTTVTLRGEMEGQAVAIEYSGKEFADQAGPEFLPRLWATRRIGDLLTRIRLEGARQEWVSEVVRLSIRYGIVTPYTSYLVTEPDALEPEAETRILAKAADAFRQAAEAPASGQAAVEASVDQAALGNASAPAGVPDDHQQELRIAGGRAFRRIDGVWTDTTYRAGDQPLRRITFLSDTYFDLAERSRLLRAAFALGPQVIVVEGGVAFAVTDG
jgi:Ca-activated chloride channel family protein